MHDRKLPMGPGRQPDLDLAWDCDLSRDGIKDEMQ